MDGKTVTIRIWRHHHSEKFTLSIELVLIEFFGLRKDGGTLINNVEGQSTLWQKDPVRLYENKRIMSIC